MTSTLRAGRLPALERFAEHRPPREEALDRYVANVTGLVASRVGRLERLRLARIVAAVEASEEAFREASDAALQQQAIELRPALRRHARPEFDAVAQSFAIIRAAAGRTIGMRHFPVQLRGGYALLRGLVAEMQTGEGKTVTATLPAATLALAGRPVHVVTVNDYLAQRDAAAMGPLYRFLGLSVGLIVAGQNDTEKREAYACDVVYCSNKELAFDYMRDCLKRGRRRSNLQLLTDPLLPDDLRSAERVMRGLHFAIVDEADSVLVDEARTPLIISGKTDPPVAVPMLQQALDVARTLRPDEHFRIRPGEHRVDLTQECAEELAAIAEQLSGRWRIRALREELIRQAIAALQLFHRDRDYLVRDGKIAIVDEYTGRIMADRQWNQGLHQLIELKEGCEVTGQRITVARMTYQRFFRRYRQLAGMTGTADEVAFELWRVYRVRVVRIPTHRPLRRQELATRLVESQDEKWDWIAARIADLTSQGRPVLLGTRSVSAAMAASAALTRHGLEHACLTAAQDAREAEVIALAGGRGRITIATNMAGRGTDIVLGEGVAELGGLHVILSERHEAGRIDRQLAGRCGRQGDPGSHEAVLSLDDPLLTQVFPRPWQRVLFRRIPAVGIAAHRGAQRYAEWVHSGMRRRLLRLTDQLGDQLAFSGPQE